MTELEFIDNPNLWPSWPVLPMIRRADRKAGFLWVGTGPVVYHENIFNLPAGVHSEVTAGLKKSQFENFAKLVEEWRVD